MSYECSDCDKSFGTLEAIESHCGAKGHDRYECGVCNTGRKFRNSDALEQVNPLESLVLFAFLSVCISIKKLFMRCASPAMNGSKMTTREKRYICFTMHPTIAHCFLWKHYRSFHVKIYCPKCSTLFVNENSKQLVRRVLVSCMVDLHHVILKAYERLALSSLLSEMQERFR